MKLCLTLIMSVLIAFGIAAQKRKDAAAWTISGSVINSVTRHNVADTIQISLLTPDSVRKASSVAYSQNGSPSNFYLNIDEDGAGKYTLVLSNPDYATAEFPIELTRRQRRVALGALPIRKLTFSEKTHALEEVTVTATKVKFYNKGDTLVYDADAFNLAQGSMLDALIDQLPGVQLDANGVITVNGKPVESLLLNGKDFFKGNRGVMLENLPAYMVKRIKVYDCVSEEDQRTGRRGNGSFTMDVWLRKEFSKGVIANADAGVGTHSRYAARAFGMLYSDRSRVAAYAKLNNTNEYRTPGRNGNWDESRAASGLQTIRQAGLDYGIYGPQNRYDVNGSFNASVNDNDIRTSVLTQNFLPEGDTYSTRFHNGFSRGVNIDTRHEFTIHTDETMRNDLSATIFGQYTHSKNKGTAIDATFLQSPEAASLRDSLMTGGALANSAVNRMLRDMRDRSRSLYGTLRTQGYFMIPGGDNAAGFSAGATGQSAAKNAPEDYRLFYGPSIQTFSDRLHRIDNKDLSVDGKGYFCWRPNNHIQVTPWYGVRYSKGNDVNDWYVADRTPQTQSEAEDIMRQLDPANSYRADRHTIDHGPTLSFFYNYNRMHNGENDGYVQFSASADANIRHAVLDYAGIQNFNIRRNFILPNIQAVLNFTTHRNFHYLDVKYFLNSVDPSLMNLMDITFTDDPLNLRRGNPNLNNYTLHRFQSNYRADGLQKKGMMLSAQIEYSRTHNAHAISTTYDRATGVKTTMPVNIDGNWNAHARSDMSFPLTRDRRLTLGATVYYRYSHNADMTLESGMDETVKTMIYNHGTWDILSMEYKIGCHRIQAKGELSYSHVEGSFAGFQTMDVWNCSYGVNGLASLPFDFQVSSDMFMHSQRGYADSGANYNSLVWNASLIKPLLGGKVTVRLDAFDILHQVRNTSVSINARGRTETIANTLPAYFMLRLAYNFSRSPKQ